METGRETGQPQSNSGRPGQSPARAVDDSARHPLTLLYRNEAAHSEGDTAQLVEGGASGVATAVRPIFFFRVWAIVGQVITH